MPRRRNGEFGVDVEVTGDVEIEAKLRELAERGRRTKPAFVQMLRDLEQAEEKWFASRGQYRWERMQDSTKRRHGEHPLLELSGTLLKSLVLEHARYGIRQSGDGELRFGTKDPVAHLVAKRRPVLAPLALSKRRLVDRLRSHILGL